MPYLNENSLKKPVFYMISVFSKIISGEIPCYKIAEDEFHFAFLDINPVAKGHTLVIPKEEIDYIFDLSDTRIGTLATFAKKVGRGIDKAMQPVRTGVIVEGLEIPHVHMHLIPMYEDRTSFSLGKSIKLDSHEMERIAKAIRKEIIL